MKLKQGIISILLIGIITSKIYAQIGYRRHATLFYYFSKNIDWSNSSLSKSENFIITILGADLAIEDFKTILSSKVIDGKKVIINNINHWSEVPLNSNLVFVSLFKSNQYQRLYNKLENSGSVIITEKKGLCLRGSHVNFVHIKGKLKFEINEKAFIKSKLKISNYLTNLAIKI